MTERHQRADTREERRALTRQMEDWHRKGVLAVHL
jgi:hypothetical protein